MDRVLILHAARRKEKKGEEERHKKIKRKRGKEEKRKRGKEEKSQRESNLHFLNVALIDSFFDIGQTAHMQR